VREIESQPIRRHERALLMHVRAQPLSQRRMEQVSGRMIPPRRISNRPVHRSGHAIAGGQASALNGHEVRAHEARRRFAYARDARP
jgi:hypothetical protein